MFKVGDKVLVKEEYWGNWVGILKERYTDRKALCWLVYGDRVDPNAFAHPLFNGGYLGEYVVAEFCIFQLFEPNDVLKDLCSK